MHLSKRQSTAWIPLKSWTKSLQKKTKKLDSSLANTTRALRENNHLNLGQIQKQRTVLSDLFHKIQKQKSHISSLESLRNQGQHAGPSGFSQKASGPDNDAGESDPSIVQDHFSFHGRQFRSPQFYQEATRCGPEANRSLGKTEWEVDWLLGPRKYHKHTKCCMYGRAPYNQQFRLKRNFFSFHFVTKSHILKP